jgi:hypothetical protein
MRDRANQRVPRSVLPGTRVYSDPGGPPANGEAGGVFGEAGGCFYASGSLGPDRRLRECIPTPGGPLLMARRAVFYSRPDYEYYD